MNALLVQSSSPLPAATKPNKTATFQARYGLAFDPLRWGIIYSAGPAIRISWWCLAGGLSGMLLAKILVKVAGRKMSCPLQEGLSALGKIIGLLAGYAVVCGVVGAFARSFPPLCMAALIGVVSALFVACLWRVPAWIGRRRTQGAAGDALERWRAQWRIWSSVSFIFSFLARSSLLAMPSGWPRTRQEKSNKRAPSRPLREGMLVRPWSW